MKRLSFILLGSLVCVTAFAQMPAWAQEPKDILSVEAHDMLNTVPNTYLIDVRTRAEYQLIGHPPMAYHFPYYFLTNRLARKGESWVYQFNDKNKSFVAEISNEKSNHIWYRKVS